MRLALRRATGLGAGFRRVNYRMLYFFHERTAIISHGLTKEDVVPDTDIDLAITRKARFTHDPRKHTCEE